MADFFPGIDSVAYEGPDSDNPLAFKHYDPNKKVMGKTMAEHLRFSVCYWHTFKNDCSDPFGVGTRDFPWADGDPMAEAEKCMDAAFEFFSKLGVGFWCFHDLDIAPEADTLAETNQRFEKMVAKAKECQDQTGVKLLWGTSNMFNHPRFMAGAGTNPDPAIFAYAASQVKRALDATNELGGQGYVFWGGREGYTTLLNTDLGLELDNLARLFHLAVDYKEKIGFDGQFYIEPKPKEPTKHQYDFDAGSCHAFLQKYDLADHLKLNVEANHATLAGHTFHHELAYCIANDLLGSVDANRGDLLLGWDTDQFPTDLYDTTYAMYLIVRGGGFTTGGLNFDAHIRRQSIDPEDLFIAHIGGMDAFARGLEAAAQMIEDGTFADFVAQRYAGWTQGLGKDIKDGKVGLEDLEAYTLEHGEPQPKSGKQELLENILNEYI
jgi:xylose isomerase